MNRTNVPPCAKQLRADARGVLKNNWGLAILVTFLAGALGGANSTLPSLSIDTTDLDLDLSQFLPGERLETIDLSGMLETILPFVIPFAIGSLSISMIFWVIGPCIRWGLCRFRLALIDGEQASVAMLFSGFRQAFFRALGLSLLQMLMILLAVLAVFAVGVIGAVILAFTAPEFILVDALLTGIAVTIPMLILTYRYSMSFYILVENPDMEFMGVLRESTRMMKGNKWRLFCLQFSFMGWILLNLLTCGLGSLFLAPYIGQAEALFYHHVSGRAAIREAVEELAGLSEGL